MERPTPTSQDERSPAAERSAADRASERHSGEGADSALAKLRKIERDRERSRPVDERSDARG